MINVLIIIKTTILPILILILIIKQTYHRLSSFYTQSYRSKGRKRNYLFGMYTLSTSQVKNTRLNKNCFKECACSTFNLLLFLLRYYMLDHKVGVYYANISILRSHKLQGYGRCASLMFN